MVCTFWAWLNDTTQCCDWLWGGNQLVPPVAVPVPPFCCFGQNLPDFHSTEKLKKRLTADFKADRFSVLSLPVLHLYEEVWLLFLLHLGLSERWGFVQIWGDSPCSTPGALGTVLDEASVGASPWPLFVPQEEQICFLWASVFFFHNFLVVQMFCFW